MRLSLISELSLLHARGEVSALPHTFDTGSRRPVPVDGHPFPTGKIRAGAPGPGPIKAW